MSDNLDELEEQIQTFKNQIGNCLWDLGNVLKKVRDGKLWLRKSNFWASYCDEIINIPRSTADNFIRLATSYDRLLVSEWGVKKLTILLPLKTEERTKILESYDPKEVTHKELSRVVRPLKKKKFAQDSSEFFRDTYFLGEEILLDISRVKIKLEDFKVRLEECKVRKDYSESAQKSKLLEINQKLVKEGGGLM